MRAAAEPPFAEVITGTDGESIYRAVIDRVEVVTRGRVRRAKLYYLRGRTGKAARIPERRDERPAKKQAAQ